MYHQLTEEERYTVALLKRQGQSMRSIARLLGRHPSTISREIQRNRCHANDGAYPTSKAQAHQRQTKTARAAYGTTSKPFTRGSSTCWRMTSGVQSKLPTDWPWKVRLGSAT